MYKHSRFDITEGKLRRFLKEGRGQGKLSAYQPWLTVRDLSSIGRSSRIWWHNTARVHHFFSDLERTCFWMNQRDESVSDIREQFPLERKITRKIAKDLGIKHPKYKGVEPYMTTDLLVDHKGDKPKKAYYVKYKGDLDDVRTFEKFCIEAEYWERKEIELKVFTEEECSQNFLENHQWLSVVEPVLSPIDVLKVRAMFYAEQLARHPHFPLTSFAQELDRKYGREATELGTSLFEIKELIAVGLLKFDFSINFKNLVCSDIQPEFVKDREVA